MSCKYEASPFIVDIEIWLPSAFPLQAPILYVAPKGLQRLRSSPLVDPTGRVFLPYFNFWHTRTTSSVLEMMNFLHQAFCQEPPIFLEKPTGLAAAQSNSTTVQSALSPQPANSVSEIQQLRVALKEKLQRRFNRLEQELSVETDRIVAQNELLMSGDKKIRKGMDALRSEIYKAEEELDQLVAKKESVLLQISQLRENGHVDPSTLIIPQGAISKQIIDSVVTDLALQDSIYGLSKAFERRKLDLATYLRSTRDLAREQFFVKALLAKIRRDFPVVH